MKCICIIINIIICFGIPLGYLVYIIATKKASAKYYFCGVMVFLVSQVFLRLPIIEKLLPKMDWYLFMQNVYPVIYCIFLGITAGIFEECGRYIGFKVFLKNNRTLENGIAFGMGHGGIEAMLIAGLSNVQELILILNGNDAILRNSGYFQILSSGIERISCIAIHVGLTLIVLYGVKIGKKRYLLLAILIHGIIDTFSGLGFSLFVVEIWCMVWAAALIIFSIRSRKLFKGDVIKNEETI